jgi:hypothetical protein
VHKHGERAKVPYKTKKLPDITQYDFDRVLVALHEQFHDYGNQMFPVETSIVEASKTMLKEAQGERMGARKKELRPAHFYSYGVSARPWSICPTGAPAPE